MLHAPEFAPFPPARRRDPTIRSDAIGPSVRSAKRRSNQTMYGISVTAQPVRMGAQTLRLYETRGLLKAARTDGGIGRPHPPPSANHHRPCPTKGESSDLPATCRSLTSAWARWCRDVYHSALRLAGVPAHRCAGSVGQPRFRMARVQPRGIRWRILSTLPTLVGVVILVMPLVF